MMEPALRALIIGHAPLTVLVPVDRIVWNHIPQGQLLPRIALFKIAGAEGLTHGGPDGLSSNLVQIDIHALTVSGMWDIRDALMSLLHGHKDETFGLINLVSERQNSELVVDQLVHRSSLDFRVWASA